MACIYTPRGLKIRMNVQDAFIYLSRVRDKFTAFQGLRIVEDIVNAPAFFAWIVAIVLLLVGVKPLLALAAMLCVRTSLMLAQRVCFRLFECVVAPLWWLVRPYSYLSGRGLFLLPLVALVYWRGGIIWAGACLVMMILIGLLDGLVISSELAFVQALFYMANKCRIKMSLVIGDVEREQAYWALCYAKLAQDFPVVTNRFLVEDGFQAAFYGCVENMKLCATGIDDSADDTCEVPEKEVDEQRFAIAYCDIIDRASKSLGEDPVIKAQTAMSATLRIKYVVERLIGSFVSVARYNAKIRWGDDLSDYVTKCTDGALQCRFGDHWISACKQVDGIGSKVGDVMLTARCEEDLSVATQSVAAEKMIYSMFDGVVSEEEFGIFRVRYFDAAHRMCAEMATLYQEYGILDSYSCKG